jgi:serine phosphatase RsbU (regulator of sigma subunit)
VARLAVPWLADWCAVDLPAPDGTIEQVALAHVDERKVAEARELRRRYPPKPGDETGVPAILNGGPPELLAEIPEELLDSAIEDPEQRRAIKALGMRSAMIVPMRVGEQTLGALTFVSSDSGRRFDETDFAFAQDLALRAAAAVQNARLYAAQRRVAYTLQASLLPDTLPPIPGFGVAAAYQAGELGADVGGDFYDVVRTADPAAHLVFLGDVTGKGVDAAALTSRVRHSIRTAARFNPNPSAILQLVNEILVEGPGLAPVSLLALLVVGENVTIAAAGHPPPLLRRAAARGQAAPAVMPVGPGGILLGVANTRAFEQQTVTLAPGDAILLYTDGVTDTPGARDRFGHDRLAEVLATAPDTPDGILAAIQSALKAFQATTATDDRAMLVLRRG